MATPLQIKQIMGQLVPDKKLPATEALIGELTGQHEPVFALTKSDLAF